MYVNFNILNQLGSPSINSNTFANRPAAGQTGRLFVSTDTFEIYRDNGTSWDLIGGPGSSTVTGTGASGQVTYWTGASTIAGNNNLFWDSTNFRLGIGTATPGTKLDVHTTAGAALQLNSTNAVGNIYSDYQNQGTTQYRVGYTDDADINYRRFGIYDSVGAKEVISIDQQSRYVGINYQYTSLTDQPQYNLDVSGSFGSQSITITGSAFLTVPSGTMATNYAASPADNTNLVYSLRMWPTLDYDAVAFPGASISAGEVATVLSPSTNKVAGTLFAYGFFGVCSTSATSVGGFTNHDVRGIYGNVYHYHPSNLIRMVGVAGRTYNSSPNNVSSAYSIWARNTRNDSTGTVTNAYGIFVDSNTVATNNYGIRLGQNIAGTTSWNIYADGTATNYLNGNTLIGTTVDAGYKLEVNGTTRSAFANKFGSYISGTTTPNVSNISALAINNSSATTITNFTNAVVGQILYLIFYDSNTTIDRSNCYLSGGINFTSTNADTLTLIYDGTYWFEIARSINS